LRIGREQRRICLLAFGSVLGSCLAGPMKRPSVSEYKLRRKGIYQQQRKRGKAAVGGSHISDRQIAQSVDKGLKQVEVKSAQAGESKLLATKNKLNYLLNNYREGNRARIESLIEQVRKLDPHGAHTEYRVRLREAIRDHHRKSQPY